MPEHFESKRCIKVLYEYTSFPLDGHVLWGTSLIQTVDIVVMISAIGVITVITMVSEHSSW